MAVSIEEFNTAQEGKAIILTPKKDEVFYNPIQQFNRDLSIMAIKAYDELRQSKNVKRRKLPSLKILEALSASGLRSCRYGLEIDNVDKIVANDMSKEAVIDINRNIKHNNLESKVVANESDAIKYMSSTKEKFHIIDLDPYGTATPFIDSAIQAIEEDGILLVTCTDAAVLAGAGYHEKCFALYGGNNFGNSYINSECNHEVGIRLMLNLIANTAARYKKSIEPLLSLSIDYYFRIFIRVKTSPIKVKNLASETMITFGCNGCGNKILQPLGIRTKGENKSKFTYPKLQPITSSCEFCNNSYNIAGPMYGGNLHDNQFINKILEINEGSDKEIYKTSERIKGMLTLAKSELTTPFFFNLNSLNSLLKSPPISIDSYCKAIGNLNYDVSLTHARKNCVKTNAPWKINLLISRQWVINQNEKLLKELEEESKKEELKENKKIKLENLKKDLLYNANLKPSSPGGRIMSNFKYLPEEDLKIKIDFETDNKVNKKIQKLRSVKMVRYQENPTKNWGPMAKPK
ncbi:unnamed protein product [Candida verbasci]|uniref:tRNA (guanine(26)-N(2))-dimethyltransferase n=1 Tax=Candida verbasci TaxID=1227364 RepID=A0A9W4XJ97_9ASCO|nr:unnamed protein product [Candida verbasci]